MGFTYLSQFNIYLVVLKIDFTLRLCWSAISYQQNYIVVKYHSLLGNIDGLQ